MLYTCLNNPKIKLKDRDQSSQYQWCGSGSELLELMLALFSSGRIKNKNSDNKINFTAFANDYQQFCNYKIADINGRKAKLMMRKKDSTPFLSDLIDSLTSRINQYLK